MMTPALVNRLIRHEGMKLRAYFDSVGKITVGIGRNLEDNGISEEEAMLLLKNDLARVETLVCAAFPWFLSLSETRQEILMEMAFNIGVPRLMGFTRMLAALKRQDYEAAANEMMASRWASEVKGRAVELANLMRGDQEPAPPAA
jgi:lysozyme